VSERGVLSYTLKGDRQALSLVIGGDHDERTFTFEPRLTRAPLRYRRVRGA
jgi:hypothetical protein